MLRFLFQPGTYELRPVIEACRNGLCRAQVGAGEVPWVEQRDDCGGRGVCGLFGRDGYARLVRAGGGYIR